MRIKLLTSSRADYSIYTPLLKLLVKEKKFEVEVIAFGSHLSPKYGLTVNAILKDAFAPVKQIETLVDGENAFSVSSGIGHTAKQFAKFWNENATDLIICLGDRYEMFAAVASSVPFNVPVAHLHGGETTLGAMDECFRHSITMMSTYHFTSTKPYAKKVEKLRGSSKNIHSVGALAIDTIKDFKSLGTSEFEDQFGFKLQKPVLCTYHPATKQKDDGISELKALISVLEKEKDQVIVTMPNSDNSGNTIRSMWKQLADNNKNVVLVESLGLKGYYTALKDCQYCIGNSSSGIIEAASFGKYVINIGDRQKGRITGKNVKHCKGTAFEINKAVKKVVKLKSPGLKNIYGDGKTAKRIVNILKKIK